MTPSIASALDATLSADAATHVITPGPFLVAQAYRRDVDDNTALCNEEECSIYDVTSRFVTVISLPVANSTTIPPFANNTHSHTPHRTPGVSGTGHVSASAITRHSSDEPDYTTMDSTYMTFSVLTTTASRWNTWMPIPSGSAAGTGEPPLTSDNATQLHNSIMPPGWASWPLPTRGPNKTSTQLVNTTFVSAGQTFTEEVPKHRETSSFMSYVTTETLVFADTTIFIPIPSEYKSSMAAASTTKTASKSSPSHKASGPKSSTLSTSSCWTTNVQSTSGSHTMAVSASSKICWILSCDEKNRCTDHVTKYPITVDGESTYTHTAHSDDTATATATTPSIIGHVSATATRSDDSLSMWMPWPTERNSTSTPIMSHSTTSIPPSDSVEATLTSSSTFESTYSSSSEDSALPGTTYTPSPSPGTFSRELDVSIHSTITRTVIPLPTTTPEAVSALRGMMNNRKRYVMGRPHPQSVVYEQDNSHE